MRRALIVAVAVVSGCDLVWLDERDEDPSCAPIPYDPARYHAPEDRIWGLTWATARNSDCARRAMDLAVFGARDTEELARQAAGAPVPFWLGVSYANDWLAVDNCKPLLQWAPNEPKSEMPGQCIAMTSAGMRTEVCSYPPEDNTEHIQALCETPRPDARCRELAAKSRYALGTATNVPREQADAMCAAMGMYVVEINGSAELDRVTQEFGSLRFWHNAKFNGMRWTSTTGCPLVFEWGPTTPSEGDVRDCAIHEDNRTRIAFCNGIAAAICEAND